MDDKKNTSRPFIVSNGPDAQFIGNTFISTGSATEKKWWKRLEIIIPIIISIAALPWLPSLFSFVLLGNPNPSSQSRRIDSQFIEKILDCSGTSTNFSVVAVVSTSEALSLDQSETSDFAALIGENLSARGKKLDAHTYLYEPSAVIPDGVSVWKATSTNFVYVGRNSINGKNVQCESVPKKLGYAGLSLGGYVFSDKENSSSLSTEIEIIEHSSTTENFGVGIKVLPNGRKVPIVSITK